MNSEERIQKQKILVEQIGKYFDHEGFQPIAGRILGLLMVMDKEQFTFDEIVEELRISKSSASNAIKNLESRGKIEYVTLPGDRKRYFQLRRQDGFATVYEFKDKLLKTKMLMSHIIELKADKNSENSKVFKELIDMADFIIGHFENYKSGKTT